jgi:peptide/nickel transport system substrate-binding protein
MNSESDSSHGISRRELLERAGAAGVALAIPGFLADPAAAALENVQRRGGVLRVGMNFGVSATLDPHATVAGDLAILRQMNVFSRLFDFDAKGRIIPDLAVSIEPNKKADVWVVKLRRGVEFHDGRPFTADDVIYSLRRILDTSVKAEAYALLQMIDAAQLKKLNAHSVRIKLKNPYSELPSHLAERTALIIKAGTTSFQQLNGTGPFRFVSQETDRNTVLAANRNYFHHGLPYVDRVNVINIVDATARVNALQANQVDAIPIESLTQLATVKGNRSLGYVVSRSAQWTPICMNTKDSPFTDVRVRRAMFLLADRKEINKVVQQGLGILGNDLFSPHDPAYAKDIPERKRDPERARALLKAAGLLNENFVLHSSEVAENMLNAALVFSQQAQRAGVNVSVQRHPADTYWTTVYGSYGFIQSDWSARYIIPQYLLSYDPQGAYAPYETGWKNAKTDQLVRHAMATPDFHKRKKILHDLQEILWQSGAYLIWGFNAVADAHRKNVKGFRPDVNPPLNKFRFARVSVR